MGGTKKSSFAAEYHHKKWMKKMKNNFASQETHGYSCSNCGARCSPNDWEYHTFEPDRGVLCFYSSLNQTSHNDYIKYGLNVYRGPNFEHNVNLAQKVKVLSGVAVKTSYAHKLSRMPVLGETSIPNLKKMDTRMYRSGIESILSSKDEVEGTASKETKSEQISNNTRSQGGELLANQGIREDVMRTEEVKTQFLGDNLLAYQDPKETQNEFIKNNSAASIREDELLTIHGVAKTTEQSSNLIPCQSSDNDILTNQAAYTDLQSDQTSKDVSLTNPNGTNPNASIRMNNESALNFPTSQPSDNELLVSQNTFDQKSLDNQGIYVLSTKFQKDLDMLGLQVVQKVKMQPSGPSWFFHTPNNDIVDLVKNEHTVESESVTVKSLQTEQEALAIMRKREDKDAIHDEGVKCTDNGLIATFSELHSTLSKGIAGSCHCGEDPNALAELSNSNNDNDNKFVDETVGGMMSKSGNAVMPPGVKTLLESKQHCQTVDGETFDNTIIKTPLMELSTDEKKNQSSQYEQATSQTTKDGEKDTDDTSVSEEKFSNRKVFKTNMTEEQKHTDRTLHQDKNKDSISETTNSSENNGSIENSQDRQKRAGNIINKQASSETHSLRQSDTRDISSLAGETNKKYTEQKSQAISLTESMQLSKDSEDADIETDDDESETGTTEASTTNKGCEKSKKSKIDSSNDSSNDNRESSDNESSSSYDEADFGSSIKKKLTELKNKTGNQKKVTPCDQEEKIYYCVSCVMKTGKVWNEVRNICVHFGIEIDQLYFTKQ